jgi:glutaminyl-peptide cyclotransferase
VNRKDRAVVTLARRVGWSVAVLAALLAVPVAGAQTPVCGYQVVAEYPHDPGAFTQGLLYSGGVLYESTGLYGESTLRRVELATGEVLVRKNLSDDYFAEGLALWGDQLLQLTWRENTCFLWDVVTMWPEGSFGYTGEGWGLTHDGRVLILSDGSSSLRFLDPVSHAELGSVAVTDQGSPVTNLNELEWIRGEVFANRFTTDRIARIDPDTGRVIAWIDLAGLLQPGPPPGYLNGIAWDDAGERLFVTGKNWPTLYEIELVGCSELRLFGDGFESGGLLRWTGALP